MRTIAGLWRWRRSALCRPTDLTEAWLALCAAALLLLGAPLAGLVGGTTAHAELSGIVREQRAHRHQVWATVERPVQRSPAGPGGTVLDPEREGYPVLAFWEGPDGVTRSGTVRAVRPLYAGDRFRVWTDDRGRLTVPPPPRGFVAAHSVVTGLVVAVLSGLAVEAGRRAAVRRLLRRRYAEWEAQWSRIGPDWGRAGSSS